MRRAVSCLLAVFVLGGVVACDPLATPTGPAPLRYRDPVFTAVTKTTGVTYGTAVNQSGQAVTLQLDVYRPTGDTVTSRPAIVWVHGGAFSFGDKSSGELVDQATQFALKGFVNVSINYRLAPTNCLGVTSQACVIAVLQAREDAQTAVRFLRANASAYGVDPTRIAIGGSSAGGITALGVGFNSQNPGSGDHQGQSSAVRAVQSISGTVFGTTAIGAGDAPSLLFHGTADLIVPYALAQNTVTAATTAGLVSILRTFTGGGHVPYTANRTQILDETRNFFYSQMDLAHAAR